MKDMPIRNGYYVLAQQLRGEIIRAPNRLIDITKLAQQYQQELCTALLGLHAFTRCDTTSAFKGAGKVKPIKTLQKSPPTRSEG
jgi:hypothetical protein